MIFKRRHKSAHLHPLTVATIQRLTDAEWFSNVGAKLDLSSAVRQVHSWDEAMTWCALDIWEDVCLEASNQLTVWLSLNQRDMYRRWNTIVEWVKPICVDLVHLKTKDIAEEHRLPKVFVDTIRWSILHACMEAEYSDVRKPDFFLSQVDWYLVGHFPCGWDGQFTEGEMPKGRLVVY